jgi:hypothetical protein
MMHLTQLSSRPLLATRTDRDLFVGRGDALKRIRRALADRLNCIVTGDPGAGRTSLLHLLLVELDTPRVLIRGSAVDDSADLLRRISAELGKLDGVAEVEQLARSGTEVIDLIDRLRRQLAPLDRCVIAVDDVPPDAGIELFGSYRDELWTVDACWLTTISAGRASALLRPPADVFFEVRVDLPPLTDAESDLLLRKRIGPGERDRMLAVGGGNPRRLIELARAFHGADEAEIAAGTDAIRRRDAALAAASKPARMLAAELETVGGASASDRLLLDRLGWTRARAVQVLKELETAGVVDSTDERSGKGRARKVYRLVTGK